ncbi:myosin-2 essential light chain-like [Tubulanus polymorphus]|uniref:myosin-2 essential light chain-like n=1 Tax=Tubulanus polymorphus TaxID=672921 RepID=UPI003DA3B586
MAKLTDKDLEILEESFNLYDSKGDGKICGSQLGEVLRGLGKNPTEAEVRKHGFTNQPDKRICFEEFIPIFAKTNTESPDAVGFIEGFKVFDKEQNGSITSAELRHLLTHLGERLKDEEVEILLQGLEDAQGNVNYEELVNTVCNE